MDMAYGRAKEGEFHEKSQCKRIDHMVRWKYFFRGYEIPSTTGRQTRSTINSVFGFSITLIQRFFTRFGILNIIKRRYAMADDKPDPT